MNTPLAKTLYLDCFSGIAGDMFTAALLDLGLDFQGLSDYIARLKLDVVLEPQKTVVNGISATRFIVVDKTNQPMRHYQNIVDLLSNRLPDPDILNGCIKTFSLLAEAEAHIHNTSIDKIHFHEIGAVDTIVDIVSAYYGLKSLNIKKVISSSLPWPRGMITISHGVYPLPAPATARLLCGVPCFGTNCEMELVTPTGAAIVRSLVDDYGPLPRCTPISIGYGAGSMSRADGIPNLLRAVLIEEESPQLNNDSIVTVEALLDDMNPEFFSNLYDLLIHNKGVIDLFTTPVFMKKNRPGFLLSVLCYEEKIHEVSELIIEQTTSLGVRISSQERLIVSRETISVSSPWGTVPVKVAVLPNGQQRFKPEYDVCANIARQHNIPLPNVYLTLNHLAYEYLATHK